MKAIILAAGEGKRMRPLTLHTPKPMIEVLGKPLLHHIIDSLPEEITELIIVVGYKGDAVRRYFGETFQGKKVTYVFQEKQLGTGHALELCRPHIGKGERFLFMIGDDLHSPKALRELLKHHFAMLVHEHADPKRFGVVEVNKEGAVTAFEEKPIAPKSNLVSPAVFVLDDGIFNYPKVLHRSGEFYAVDQINQMMKDEPLIAVKSDFWHPIGYPEDVESAEEILKRQKGITETVPNKIPVFIIAGGKGTRMPESEKDKPKVLVEIAGNPMLFWQFNELRRQGFENITLSLGYRADLVIQWLKTSGNGHVRYVIEREPLGTGGGLKLAAKGVTEPFIAINADDLADVNFRALVRHGGGKWNALAGFHIADARAFGLMKCDEYKKICSFEEKKPDADKGGIVNIGHYYLFPDVLEGAPDAFSLESDIFPALAAKGNLLLYAHTGYWLPTGTPEQLQATREYFSKSRQ